MGKIKNKPVRADPLFYEKGMKAMEERAKKGLANIRKKDEISFREFTRLATTSEPEFSRILWKIKNLPVKRKGGNVNGIK